MELKQQCTTIASILFILLIVPYGIETQVYGGKIINQRAFNCTLWN